MDRWETSAAGHRVSGRVPLDKDHKMTEVDRMSWSRCRLFRCWEGWILVAGWPWRAPRPVAAGGKIS